MPSETLKIIVTLKDHASRNLRKLGIGIKGLSSVAGTVTKALFSLQGAIAGVGVGLLAKSFTNAASTAEQYRTRLNVLLRSQSEGNRLFKEMSEFAGTVSFSYEQIMGSATNLAGVMEGGVDEIKDWMPGIANLAAASGLSIQDTTSQIVRMYSAGAASADLFRERGVLTMLKFQAGVSYSAEETRKRLMEVFEDPNSRIAGAATELAKTWEGMMGMLGDAWFQFRNLVMESGVFDYMKSAVRLFLDFIARLKSEGRLDVWAQQMADGVLTAFGVILKTIGFVADAWRGWLMIWQVLKIGFGAFAQIINEGLSQIAKGVEWLLGGVGKKMAAFGAILQKIPFIISPTLRGLGDMLVNADKLAISSGEIAKETEKNAAWWGEVAKASSEQLQVLAQEESTYTRLSNLHDLLIAKTKTALELTKQQRAANDKPGGGAAQFAEVAPSASISAILASQLARSKEAMRTSLAELQKIYSQGEIDLAGYFSRRKEMVIKQFQLELSILQQQLSTAEDPAKRLAVEDKIFALRQSHHRAILAMDMEQAASEDELVRKRLQAANLISNAQREGLQAVQEGADAAYDASGGKIKEFFYVSKAASVAETVMSTYQGAQAAFTGMATAIPGPLGIAAGIAAAGAAIVQGLARAAMIRGQQLAEGGTVGGVSPHSKSDNININATAGEFMQPVSAVKYYGKAAMEALRRKALPREIFSGFALPVPRETTKFAYATGGAITGGGGEGGPMTGTGTGVRDIKIMNYVDQKEMLAALGTPDGEDAIINVISRRRDKVSQVLK